MEEGYYDSKELFLLWVLKEYLYHKYREKPGQRRPPGFSMRLNKCPEDKQLFLDACEWIACKKDNIYYRNYRNYIEDRLPLVKSLFQ